MDKNFFADGIFASGRMSIRLKKKGISALRNSALASAELVRWNKMQGAGVCLKKFLPPSEIYRMKNFVVSGIKNECVASLYFVARLS